MNMRCLIILICTLSIFAIIAVAREDRWPASHTHAGSDLEAQLAILEFCGQGGNAVNWFLGPARAIGQELIKDNAACNGFDADTAAGADEIPWTDFGLSYTVRGMYCTTDGGVNDTVDMVLYDDEASTGVTCTITSGGGIADCSDDEVEQPAVAGASLMAVLADPDDDDLSAVNYKCMVPIAF